MAALLGEGGRKRPFHLLLALLLPPVLVFAAVGGHEFLSYDDVQNIVANPLVSNFSWANLRQFWTEPQLKLYIPATYTGWSLLGQLSRWWPGSPELGLKPGVFHLANLALHLGAVALLFHLARQLLGERIPALVCALLFALHPVQVEAVAWVTGMKDLLAGFFGIAGLWSYVRFSRGVGRRRGYYYGLASLAFLLAMLAKPSSVVLPLLAGVVGYFWLERGGKKVLVELGPWLLLALPVVWITRQAQEVAPDFLPTLGQRFLIAGDAVSFYLYKLLLPLQLGADYGRSPQFLLAQGWAPLTGLAPYLLLPALLCSCRRRWLTGAIFFFLVALLPVLGFISFAFQGASTVADRYLYLGLVGPAMAIGYLLRRSQSPSGPRLALAALLLLGGRSAMLVPHWHDNATFYQATLAVNPRSWFAWNNLGLVRQGEGRNAEAIAALEKAIGLKPDYAAAWNNLGVVYKAAGRGGEARQAFARAVAADPAFAEAYVNQGNLSREEGRWAEARGSYQQAIAARPGFAEPYASLGILAKEANRRDEALAYYRQALARQPDFPEVYNNLGIIHEESGRHEEAIAAYRQAIALKGDFAEACNNLGHLYAGLGREREAIPWFEKAMAIYPGHPLPYHNLALAYLRLGQREEARKWFEKAVAVDPTFLPARESLVRFGRP